MTGRRDVWAAAFAKPSRLWEPVPNWQPREWTPLARAVGRIESSGGYSAFPETSLHQDLEAGRLRSVLRLPLNDDGSKQLLRLLHPRFWRHLKIVGIGSFDALETSVEGNVAGRRLEFAGRLFFVHTADLDKYYSVAAAARQPDVVQPPPDFARPPEDFVPPPLRRRGPPPKLDQWFPICGEIARRCIDAKTGLVLVPEKESALADEILQWLEDQNLGQPAQSQMRKAVKYVCAALRTAQK